MSKPQKKKTPHPEWRIRNGGGRGRGQGSSWILTCKTCWMLRSQETQCCWNISVELSPTSKDSRQRPSNLVRKKWVITRWRPDFRESYLLLFHTHWTRPTARLHLQSLWFLSPEILRRLGVRYRQQGKGTEIIIIPGGAGIGEIQLQWVHERMTLPPGSEPLDATGGQ